MGINKKTFISLIKSIIRETQVDEVNNESNILKIARNRSAIDISRSEAKLLLDKYSCKHRKVKCLDGDDTATCKYTLTLYYAGEHTFPKGGAE